MKNLSPKTIKSKVQNEFEILNDYALNYAFDQTNNEDPYLNLFSEYEVKGILAIES